MSESEIPKHLHYTREHEWIALGASDALPARVGISWHAQHELGDIVFLELPQVGRHVERGEAVAVVESVKSVSDIYSPIKGTISARNESVEASTVNSDPYGAGWLFEIAPAAGSVEAREGLLSSSEYRDFLGTL